MTYTIENECLRVTCSDRGAELQSVWDKEKGEELLWQGDPSVWSGRSPLLFPVVGKLKDDTYTYQGRAYAMRKHGFASKTAFEVTEKETGSVTLCCDGADYRDIYPFDFTLFVTYALDGNRLFMRYRVENRGDGEMYFSLGAHPGFNCAMGEHLYFDEDATADAHCLIGEQKLLSKEPLTRGIEEHRLTITPDVFAQDALIFEGLRSKHAVLIKNGKPRIDVAYGDAPCLGVWAKPAAPYVCVEPWYGIDDTEDVTGDITQKPHIQRLAPNDAFRCAVTVTVLG